jgi:hypothetical protein
MVFKTEKYSDIYDNAKAKEILKAGGVSGVEEGYRVKEGGKEYTRLLLKNSEGKVFDYRMNSIDPKTVWMDIETWKRKLGLGTGVQAREIKVLFEKEETGKAFWTEEQKKSATQGKPPLKPVVTVPEHMREAEADATAQKKAEKPASAQAMVRTYADFLKDLENSVLMGGKDAAKNFEADMAKFFRNVSPDIIKLVMKYAEKEEVDWKLVLAYIFVESKGKKDAEPKKPAPYPKQSYGLMQLKPETAGLLAIDKKTKKPKYSEEMGKALLFTPDFNIRKGTGYLSDALKAQPDKPALGILGYNTGIGGAESYANGNYQYKTSDKVCYVTRVMHAYKFINEAGVDALASGALKVDGFLASEKYNAALANAKQFENKGGYLADSDLGRKFCK